MMVSNRNLLFQGSIFRFHVCFGGCKGYNPFTKSHGHPSTAWRKCDFHLMGCQSVNKNHLTQTKVNQELSTFVRSNPNHWDPPKSDIILWWATKQKSGVDVTETSDTKPATCFPELASAIIWLTRTSMQSHKNREYLKKGLEGTNKNWNTILSYLVGIVGLG